jgi:dephospho-CoA kinase
MHLFGLTGGIATGKSTVSKMFAELGVPIIDADVVAREVVAPGQAALEEIARRFPGVVDAQGRLDRAKLAARIFGDPKERAALNAITHPRIQKAVQEKTRRLAETGEARVLYDAALLIENGLHRGLHGVVLVVVPPDVQRRRLMERDRLTQADADARIASQMPLDEKRAYATWIVDNSGTLDDTRRQVERIFREMQALPADA